MARGRGKGARRERERERTTPPDGPQGAPGSRSLNRPSGSLGGRTDTSGDNSPNPTDNPSDNTSGDISDTTSNSSSNSDPEISFDDDADPSSSGDSDSLQFDGSDASDASEHSVFGRCHKDHPASKGHEDEYDCTCLCNSCRRNVSRRPEVIRGLFQSGRLGTVGRVNFRPPAPLGPHQIPQRWITGRPPDITTMIRQVHDESEETENVRSFPDDQAAPQQRPCTEMIPWKTKTGWWEYPCPNDGRELEFGDLYQGRIEMCQTTLSEGAYLGPIPPGLRHTCPHADQDPPGSPGTANGRRYVCAQHLQDSKDFYEVEKLRKAHLVAPCQKHMKEFKQQHPDGYNSCTCRNLLEEWQCRWCFNRDVKTLQNHFRRRVLARHDDDDLQGGLADPNHDGWHFHLGGGWQNHDLLRPQDYHLNWQEVRKKLVEHHPCHHRCGEKRVLDNTTVLDCRACGGLIVKPKPSSSEWVPRQPYHLVPMTPNNELPPPSDNETTDPERTESETSFKTDISRPSPPRFRRPRRAGARRSPIMTRSRTRNARN